MKMASEVNSYHVELMDPIYMDDDIVVVEKKNNYNWFMVRFCVD